ncbi:MAG: hypothetical protein NVS2B4_13190 [Ramlibacter sp.]
MQADQQRGDAYGFLKAMGGLAAAPGEQLDLGADAPAKARIYTEPTTTRYGETGSRIKGVELVQPGEGVPREKGKEGEEKGPALVVLRMRAGTRSWEAP